MTRAIHPLAQRGQSSSRAYCVSELKTSCSQASCWRQAPTCWNAIPCCLSSSEDMDDSILEKVEVIDAFMSMLPTIQKYQDQTSWLLHKHAHFQFSMNITRVTYVRMIMYVSTLFVGPFNYVVPSVVNPNVTSGGLPAVAIILKELLELLDTAGVDHQEESTIQASLRKGKGCKCSGDQFFLKRNIHATTINRKDKPTTQYVSCIIIGKDSSIGEAGFVMTKVAIELCHFVVSLYCNVHIPLFATSG